MSYLQYLFILFFIPAMSFALPNLTSENYFAYSDTPTLSSSSLYLASNDDYSNGGSANTISQGRYIGGGVASMFLGFGIGHAVQGRWLEGGWVHTALQSGTLVVFMGVLWFTGLQLHFGEVDSRSITATVGLGLVLSGLKIWELIDVWMLPDSIRVISSSPQNSVFPSLYSYEYKANAPGVRLQWQF